MTDTTTTPQDQAGRVTLDEIRSLLDEQGIDPNATNASKIRKALGDRGSYETIQRALVTIRAELAAAALPPQPTTVPPPPPEAMSQIWYAAWQSASAVTARRTEILTAERDAARLAVAAAAEDLSGAQEIMGQLTEQMTQAEESMAAAQQAAAAATSERDAAVIAFEAAKSGDVAAMVAIKAAADMAIERARATVALADAEHRAAMSAMRAELEHLVSQQADLRNALAGRPVDVDALRDNHAKGAPDGPL